MKTHHPENLSFGIVQGRLTPAPEGQLQWFPQEFWEEEFSAAKKVGIQFIELLAERQFNPLNPIWSEAGRQRIKDLCQSNGLSIYSICTDYIIDHSLLDDPEGTTFRRVQDFLEVATDLGCKVIVLPLLEKSDLTIETAEQFVGIIKTMARSSVVGNIDLCIESLLDGANLKTFIDKVDESNVKAVFDSGNRVVHTLGIDEEIRLLGGRIGHFHVKDKDAEGENVLLGTGLVNFAKVFKALAELDYRGPLVFEATRGREPLNTALYHIDLCKFFIHEAKGD